MKTHEDGFARVAAPWPSRHNSRKPKVFGPNSELSQYRAGISVSPMLASTVVAQSPTLKKKNTVRTPHYFIAMSPPPHIEPRARPSRATSTARRRGRDRRCDCDASTSSVDQGNRLRSPAATGTREGDAEGDCRSGFRCPCRSVSFSGIRLRRIPPSQPFSQFTPAVGGSAGVPDSLDTKQVSTSGQAAASRAFASVHRLVASVIYSPCRRPGFHFYLFNYMHSCAALCLAGVVHCCNPSQVADQHKWKWKSSRRIENPAKSSKLVPENYCAAARDRVTFVVSPGKPEPQPNQIDRPAIRSPGM
jgi:hypothetical protein